MYMLKNGINVRMNKTQVSQRIGISREYLSYIFNRKKPCSKVVAFCITKYINPNAEILDYFERIQ